jgi:hypothetical protein
VIRLVALVALLAGCDPIWALNVKVQTPTGEPIGKAALILTDCPDQNTHPDGSVVSLTDAKGEGGVAGMGFEYPPCNVTIAKPGYITQQTSFDQICSGKKLEDCYRVKTRTFVLQPQP